MYFFVKDWGLQAGFMWTSQADFFWYAVCQSRPRAQDGFWDTFFESCCHLGCEHVKTFSQTQAFTFSKYFPQSFPDCLLPGQGGCTARPQPTWAAGAERCLEIKHTSRTLHNIIPWKKMHKKNAEQHYFVAQELTWCWETRNEFLALMLASCLATGETIATFTWCRLWVGCPYWD